MRYEGYGRSLIRIEPAMWTWRGLEMGSDDINESESALPLSLSKGQGITWGSAQGASATRLVRIGDAERDHAVSALSDHFAAGRLTREEFDERSDRAMQARFRGDLEPLFVDLPRPARNSPVSGPRRAGPPFMFLPFFWLAPMLVVAAVVAAVVLSAPWIIWTFLWVFMFMGFFGRRRFHHRR